MLTDKNTSPPIAYYMHYKSKIIFEYQRYFQKKKPWFMNVLQI